MLYFDLHDVADLFVYDLIVLADKVDVITVLSVFPEELDPVQTVFFRPHTAVEQGLALIQYQKGLMLYDLSVPVTFMELEGEPVEPVQVGVTAVRDHALHPASVLRVDGHPVRVGILWYYVKK